MSNLSLVAVVKAASLQGDIYHPERSLYSILSAATSEVGETATEVAIAMGDSYKQAGPDGVVGEAIDAIASLLDLIHKYDPTITEEEIATIAQMKCAKWIEKISAVKSAPVLAIKDEWTPPWKD